MPNPLLGFGGGFASPDPLVGYLANEINKLTLVRIRYQTSRDMDNLLRRWPRCKQTINKRFQC